MGRAETPRMGFSGSTPLGVMGECDPGWPPGPGAGGRARERM